MNKLAHPGFEPFTAKVRKPLDSRDSSDSGKSSIAARVAPPLLTLPAVVADAQFFASQVAVAAVGAAAVVPAVGDVAGLAFPVVLAFAVHPSRHRVGSTAPAVARAVVGTRVYSETRAKKK